MFIRRLYHVSHCNFGNNNFKKQGSKLLKMINPKAKKQWYPPVAYEPILPSTKSLTKSQNEPGKRGERRLAMLNKMFMKNITDLMSTGSLSMDILGRGIEISKVKISPDFQTVNVFWVCKGNTEDHETDALLNNLAGPLRHELSTLRLMGEIPYIQFVKDRQEALLVDLDRRLAVADYGADYTPTELGHLLKTEFTLDSKISSEMQAKIKQLEDQEPLEEDPIPEMTHNVFGFDHATLMGRLLAARKRSRDAWRRLGGADEVITYRTEQAGPAADVGAQRRELADFLQKRQILQNKLHKQIRKSQEDWQLNNEKKNEEEYYYDKEFEEEEDYYEEEYDRTHLEHKDSTKVT